MQLRKASDPCRRGYGGDNLLARLIGRQVSEGPAHPFDELRPATRISGRLLDIADDAPHPPKVIFLAAACASLLRY